MLRFLSPEWIDALGEAVREDRRLRDAFGEATITIQQVVTDGSGSEVEYHIVIDHGSIAVRPGCVESPTVTFTVDRETAAGISSGTTSAQTGFMTGHLRLDGDVGALLRHQGGLAELADAFASLRSITDFDRE